MRPVMCVRVFALAAAVGLLSPAPAYAQTYTWNQPTSGGDWLSALNWLGGGPPDAAGTVAVFGNVATGAHTVALSANVTLGELRFDTVNNRALAPAYTIGTSAQTITFNNGGSANLLTVTGQTRANQIVAAQLGIGTGQPLTVTNTGATGLTTLTLSGGINAAGAGTAVNFGGSSNTTVSGVIGGNVGVLTKSGSGVLVLSGASAYTGGTVINGGTVSVGADNNLGAGGTGVTLNGGTLRLTTNNFGTGRAITLGAGGGTILATAPNSTTTPILGGVISGSGPLTLDGGWYLAFQNNNTYTGPTVINNAGLNLNTPLFGGGSGQLTGTSSITINGFAGGQVGILTIDNTGQTHPDRVGDSIPITLNGGILSFTAGLFGNATETVGDLTVNGFGTLNGSQIPGAGTTGVLTAGAISRSDEFATLYVGGPVFGPSLPNQSIQIQFADGLFQPSGSSNQIGIIPWIGGDRGGRDALGNATGAPTNHAETLYTYNDTNGLVALDSRSTTNFVQVASGSIQSNRNIALTGDPSGVLGNLSILSLVVNPNAGVSSTITGIGTLTVTTGAVANVWPLIFDGPTLNFGANTAYLHLGNEFIIADTNVGLNGTSRITGSGGVVVSSNSDDSRNTLYLINKTNSNSFSGGLYLNGTARVAFDAANTQLGAAAGVISFRGGGLRYLGEADATLATGATNRQLELAAAGGGSINVEVSGVTLTVPGLVTGPEQLTKFGSGILLLTNPSNDYAGGTTVAEGTLALGDAGSIGTGPLTLGQPTLVGASVRFDFSGTLPNPVTHTVSTSINTNGNSVTLSGVVTGTGTALTKTGAGTLTLAAANTYTGNTIVNAGTLLVTNTTGSGTGFGAVTVNSGASLGGTGTVGGPVTVNSGGSLIVGTPTGPGTLTLGGATTLNSAATFRGTLAGATAGTGYSQLVVPAGGSINLGSAALDLTLSYTPNPAHVLFLVNNQNATGGLTGTFGGLPQGATVTFPDGTTALISYVGDVGSLSATGGNDVVLYSFVPVPEPASVLGLAAVAVGGLAWRRRRARLA